MAMPIASDKDLQAQMDMDSLERAEEIRNDPDRVRRARRAARNEAERLRGVADADEKRDETPERRGYTVLSRGR